MPESAQPPNLICFCLDMQQLISILSVVMTCFGLALTTGGFILVAQNKGPPPDGPSKVSMGAIILIGLVTLSSGFLAYLTLFNNSCHYFYKTQFLNLSAFLTF